MGLRLWVRFGGVTVEESVIVPENPPRLVRVRVDDPENPSYTLRVLGVEDREKSRTFTVTETEWERVPSVPVTVTVYEPPAVAVTVSVELPEAPLVSVIDPGLNEAEGPPGSTGETTAESATVPV